MPWYYEKETVWNTWSQTIEGYLVWGTFTEDPKQNDVQIQICAKVLEDERRG
jgi:hypothetical protein